MSCETILAQGEVGNCNQKNHWEPLVLGSLRLFTIKFQQKIGHPLLPFKVLWEILE